MADEPQTEAQAPDMESPDFDWGKFFLEDEEPAAPVQVEPVAIAPTPPAAEEPETEQFADDDVEQVKKKLAQLEQMVAQTNETTKSIQQRDQVKAAVEAWASQAKPEERPFAAMLEGAASLEELKQRETFVKQAASLVQNSRMQIEQEVQRQFGLPVSPTFSPVPESEKVKEMLENNDLDAAASALLKGVFNT